MCWRRCRGGSPASPPEGCTRFIYLLYVHECVRGYKYASAICANTQAYTSDVCVRVNSQSSIVCAEEDRKKEPEPCIECGTHSCNACMFV